MMSIPGRAPKTAKVGKPKVMLSGLSGVGKTHMSLDFPNAFHIDVEGGAELNHYQDKLAKSGGRYFGRDDGSQDFAIVNQTIQWLATHKHEYKTLVIDSFTKLYMTEAARAEEKVGNDYGRDRKEANKPTRRMIQRIDALDMNVILVCHSKALWRNNECVGTTYDGYDKLEYELHLWIEAIRRGKDRVAVVRKSRLQGFQDGDVFPLTYADFARRYGIEAIEATVTPIVLVAPEKAAELARLVEVLQIPKETIEKWLDKAGAGTWAEMPAGAADKCVTHLQNLIAGKGGRNGS